MDTQSTSSSGADDGASAQAPQAPGAEPLSPRLVIRGESYIEIIPETGEKFVMVPVDRRGRFRHIPLPADGSNPYAAITDWLNFSFPFVSDEGLGPQVTAASDKARLVAW